MAFPKNSFAVYSQMEKKMSKNESVKFHKKCVYDYTRLMRDLAKLY
jgi:hypothetical protein